MIITKPTEVRFEYKCRRCGEMFQQYFMNIENKAQLDSEVADTAQGYLLIPHHCDDSSLGVADLIGATKETK